MQRDRPVIGRAWQMTLSCSRCWSVIKLQWLMGLADDSLNCLSRTKSGTGPMLHKVCRLIYHSRSLRGLIGQGWFLPISRPRFFCNATLRVCLFQ